MIVVSDTGPIHYLVLLRHPDVLQSLFGGILLPPVVLRELSAPNAPPEVRTWAELPPDWIAVRAPQSAERPPNLDAGEAEAIALCREVGGLLLTDDKRATTAARQLGLESFGTLKVLQIAHARRLLHIDEVLDALTETNFRATPDLLARVRASARG